MSCIFCPGGIARNSILLEGIAWWARMDIHPVSPMHTLIIPKRHVTSFRELTAKEWEELQLMSAEVVHLIERKDAASIRDTYQNLREEGGKLVYWFATKVLEHPKLGQKPDGYNMGFNLGQAAGQTVEHLHWHIIPRYQDDVEDPRGGIRNVIPQFANYKAIHENE